jgi:hypothetical protein
VPVLLERFLMRACAPLRVDRFRTAKEMSDALDAVAASIG